MNPTFWLLSFLEHCYYLLPLCVHVSLPFVRGYVPSPVQPLLEAPVPDQMQRLHAFAWLLGPLVCCALGSYCVDSKNQFCFFPGTPFYHRVLQCSLLSSGPRERDVGITGKAEDMEGTDCDPRTGADATGNPSARHAPKEKEMAIIRKWALAHNPPETQSSHWWYTDLTGETRKAFDKIAYSSQVGCMFRELFSTRNYYCDVVTGMNEIYISGPSRFDEAANSDNVFYTRHVDGPFGLLPFVSVYRCIVGLDRNEKVSGWLRGLPGMVFIHLLFTLSLSPCFPCSLCRSRRTSRWRTCPRTPARGTCWASTSTGRFTTSPATTLRRRSPTSSAWC